MREAQASPRSHEFGWANEFGRATYWRGRRGRWVRLVNTGAASRTAWWPPSQSGSASRQRPRSTFRERGRCCVIVVYGRHAHAPDARALDTGRRSARGLARRVALPSLRHQHDPSGSWRFPAAQHRPRQAQAGSKTRSSTPKTPAWVGYRPENHDQPSLADLRGPGRRPHGTAAPRGTPAYPIRRNQQSTCRCIPNPFHHPTRE